MPTSIDKDCVRDAYDDVRDDDSPTLWAVFKYDGQVIKTDSTGEHFAEFQAHFKDEEGAFGFLRVTTGDELSKRAKFVMVTWVGCGLSAMKRARMGPDKAMVRQIVKSFACEIHTGDLDELQEAHVRDAVKRAGGANYGTGAR